MAKCHNIDSWVCFLRIVGLEVSVIDFPDLFEQLDIRFTHRTNNKAQKGIKDNSAQ